MKQTSGFSLKDARIQRPLQSWFRGGSQRVVDEADRSIHDALMVVKDVLENPIAVAGGGAPEAYVANELRQWSSNMEGQSTIGCSKVC